MAGLNRHIFCSNGALFSSEAKGFGNRLSTMPASLVQKGRYFSRAIFHHDCNHVNVFGYFRHYIVRHFAAAEILWRRARHLFPVSVFFVAAGGRLANTAR
jgi:hypothetical protein